MRWESDQPLGLGFAGNLRKVHQAVVNGIVLLGRGAHRMTRSQHGLWKPTEDVTGGGLVRGAHGEVSLVKLVQVRRRFYRPGHRYAKAGVLCLGLVSGDEKEASLFRENRVEQTEREKRLMAAVDKLSLFDGWGTVRAATAGFYPRWAVRQASKSPLATPPGPPTSPAPSATMVRSLKRPSQIQPHRI